MWNMFVIFRCELGHFRYYHTLTNQRWIDSLPRGSIPWLSLTMGFVLESIVLDFILALCIDLEKRESGYA